MARTDDPVTFEEIERALQEQVRIMQENVLVEFRLHGSEQEKALAIHELDLLDRRLAHERQVSRFK